MKNLLVILAACLAGCSTAPRTQHEPDQADEWTRGFNAAIAQFAPEDKAGELIIRENAYTSQTHQRQIRRAEGSYADGYHKALETLQRTTACPAQNEGRNISRD